MTDIDVSGCEHCKHIYKNGGGECAAYFLENGDSTVSCSEIPNCYYKQLKRLEQENQELGKIIDCKNGTIATLVKVRDELKQENAKLKSTVELIKEYALDMEVWSYIRKDLLDIIEGAEDE